MKDSTAGATVRRARTTIRPQRYLNDADLGAIDVAPGSSANTNIFSVEGFLDATLQVLDLGGGTAGQFIELAAIIGSETDGFAGGPVVQVIAFAGWIPAAPAWTQVTWSWARVRPVARRVRLRFRSTSGAGVDEFIPTMRLLMRGAPNRERLKVNA